MCVYSATTPGRFLYTYNTRQKNLGKRRLTWESKASFHIFEDPAKQESEGSLGVTSLLMNFFL